MTQAPREIYRAAGWWLWICGLGVLLFGGGGFGVNLALNDQPSRTAFLWFFGVVTLLYAFLFVYSLSVRLEISESGLSKGHLFDHEEIPFSRIDSIRLVPGNKVVLFLSDGTKRSLHTAVLENWPKLLDRLRACPQTTAVNEVPFETNAARGVLRHLSLFASLSAALALAFGVWGWRPALLVGVAAGLIFGAIVLRVWKRQRAGEKPSMKTWWILWSVLYFGFMVTNIEAISLPVRFGSYWSGVGAGFFVLMFFLRSQLRDMAEEESR